MSERLEDKVMDTQVLSPWTWPVTQRKVTSSVLVPSNGERGISG